MVGTAVIPGESIPSLWWATIYDKWVHFFEYAVLFLVSYAAFRHAKSPKLKKDSFSKAIFYCFFLGTLTELLQFFVPGRSMETADWIVNLVAALSSAAWIRFASASSTPAGN